MDFPLHARIRADVGPAKVVVVIAVVDPHPAVIDLKDPVDEAAEKVPVMADQDDRAVELLQGRKQDLAGQDVQVVGRLVEYQQIEGLGQQFGQDDPAFFAAGQIGDPFVDIVSLKEEGGAEVADDADVLKRHGLLDSLENRMVRFRMSMACWLK